MGKLEDFKGFVKNNPVLLKHVRDNTMTWQQFYEMYDLYGDEESTWSSYLKIKEPATEPKNKVSFDSIGSVFAWLKGLDLERVQDGMESLNRVIGVVGDLSNNNSSSSSTTSTYKPRPLYKHFDD